MTRPRRQGVVAVIERRGRLLVIRRSSQVVAPRAFCFPGGGVEPGETEEAALVRELEEELNIGVVPIRRVWQSRTPWNVELAWWLAQCEGEPICNAAEVESCHWHTPDEIGLLDGLLESNRAFLAALERGEIELSGA